jgi:hypothetical protein
MESNNRRKEEIYTQVVKAGKRTYFFDVKETKNGEKYVTITESRKIFQNEDGRFVFEKNKIYLYKEDFFKFVEGLQDAIGFCKKEEGFSEESSSLDIEDNNLSLDDVSSIFSDLDDDYKI